MSDDKNHAVLLVDDEIGILKALRRLLKNLDVKVYTASSGKEGLDILKQHQMALIISDQRMPEMTGVQFLCKSRSISPDSIRILLTGYADINATIEAINKGAVEYYINKPWDDQHLLAKINESLNMYGIVAENRRLGELNRMQNLKLKQMNENLEKQVADQTEEIRKQNQQLAKNLMETIQAFSILTEHRSKEVGSHSQRVAKISQALIEDKNLSRKDYQDIFVSAFLHDIGKICFTDKILFKNPSEYTNSDFKEIKKHVSIGQRSLFVIRGFESIGLIIRHNHENHDG